MLSRIRGWFTTGAEETIEEHDDMASGSHIIVGLGNPGRNYANTRHNLGFMVVDELARRTGAATSRKRFRSELIETRFADRKLVLVKPQTYMNESGHAVREVMSWYRADASQVLIIVDDLDLPFGQLRLRPGGSAGGHNGLKSIFEQTGRKEIPRLRIGIGRGPNQAKAHVLSHFAPSEQEHLPLLIESAADAAELWMTDGIVPAMNEINGRGSVISESADTSETPV